MYDADGILRNVQTISPEGDKRYLPHGRKKGLMHIIGNLARPVKSDLFILAEGYATGKSIHDATGLPVIVAFDAHNLQPVAEALRNRNPTAAFIIAGDNDHHRDPNVGLQAGFAAAHAVRGVTLFPEFTEEEKAQGLTDFNDLARSRGPNHLAQTFDRVLAPLVNQSRSRDPGRAPTQMAL
jgi:phage/plasmid primase-like uncharacterized protein